MDINIQIQNILIWFDSVFPRGENFITILASVALLFTSYEFFNQYRAVPKRVASLILFIFFLFDGIDYGVFALQDILGPLADLLGIVCDMGVTITAIIFVFRHKEAIRQSDHPL